MNIEIFFMSGAGNLFTVIDNTCYGLTAEQASSLAVSLCNNTKIQRKPTEGLMLLNMHSEFAFECLFFNPDGSSGMMCGNGARCIVHFAKTRGLIADHVKSVEFLMNDNTYKSSIAQEWVEIEFGSPREVRRTALHVNGSKIPAVFVDNTSDHVCINYEDVHNGDSHFDNFEIVDLSLDIQKLTEFPKSVNVNYYSILKDNKITLRTFERGVNAETGACGTGALAVGVALDMHFNSESARPYTIYPSSKQPLSIDKRGKFHYLKGPAEILGQKNIEI